MKRCFLSQTKVINEVQKRLNELKEIQQIIEKRIHNYPAGKIHIHRRKNLKVQYGLKMNSSGCEESYLSLNNTEAIKQYIQKKYDEEVIALINCEISALEKLVAKTSTVGDRIKEAYSKYPDDVKKFIVPFDCSDADFVDNWNSAIYEKKYIDSEKKNFQTEKGDFVRSKSELIIANKLYQMNIPYKYECPLILSSGVRIYPDFTVLDIDRRCNIYWEHRGMMDDREYVKHTVKRIREYEQNGYYLGDRLIITEETANEPLETANIDRIIKHYFRGGC